MSLFSFSTAAKGLILPTRRPSTSFVAPTNRHSLPSIKLTVTNRKQPRRNFSHSDLSPSIRSLPHTVVASLTSWKPSQRRGLRENRAPSFELRASSLQHRTPDTERRTRRYTSLSSVALMLGSRRYSIVWLALSARSSTRLLAQHETRLTASLNGTDNRFCSLTLPVRDERPKSTSGSSKQACSLH